MINIKQWVVLASLMKKKDSVYTFLAENWDALFRFSFSCEKSYATISPPNHHWSNLRRIRKIVCFALICEKRNTHLNSGLVQFGGPRQFLPAVYVRIMRFCKRRFQFCQLLLGNNWKAVVKADLNYPAGNFGAIRKIRANRNVIIDRRIRCSSAGICKKYRRYEKKILKNKRVLAIKKKYTLNYSQGY